MSFLIRSDHAMQSIHLLGLMAVILVVSYASGCAGDADVSWSTGTPALLQDRDAPRVLARVPLEQRAAVRRRSLTIPNGTPVVIVDDPASRTLAGGSIRSEPPDERVRVVIAKGEGEGTEVIVRRQDLAFRPGPNEPPSLFLPILILSLMTTATVVSSIGALARR